MPNMLTQEDIVVIGQIVENGIKTHVPPIVKAAVDEMVEGIGEVIDESILPRFDEIDRRLVKIESEMVTKEYLDDKLAHYVMKPKPAF